jgi:predicted RecA/RadA family phage recombinase
MRMGRRGSSSIVSGSIVLIGLLMFTAALSLSLYSFAEGSVDTLKHALDAEKMRVGTSLELTVLDVGERNVTALVRNTGSTTVFLKPGWNDLIVYYSAGGQQLSYLAAFNATVRVTGSQTIFSSEHNFINPGEEAVVVAKLPESAPDILSGSTVVVVFASHYGVSAVGEAVKP